jgi:signal peptidase I
MFEGTSMLPTFSNGDRLLINHDLGEIKRGDIIQFKYPQDTTKYYLKRVVGLPNETVEIRGSLVVIDGKALIEDYIDQSLNQSMLNFPPKRVAENEFFVLGDNRDNSADSRYWGIVNMGLIVGKFYAKY